MRGGEEVVEAPVEGGEKPFRVFFVQSRRLRQRCSLLRHFLHAVARHLHCLPDAGEAVGTELFRTLPDPRGGPEVSLPVPAAVAPCRC